MDYSKKSWSDLTKCLKSPPDTPNYIHAKGERDHRLKLYGIFLAGAALLLSVLSAVSK